MRNHPKHINPSHCFCYYSEEELLPWIYKRYVDKISTVELLASTEQSREREIIGIVALLDVDEESLLREMGDVDMPEHHIIHCRDYAKKLRDSL